MQVVKVVTVDDKVIKTLQAQLRAHTAQLAIVGSFSGRADSTEATKVITDFIQVRWLHVMSKCVCRFRC